MDPIAPGHPITEIEPNELTREEEVSTQQYCALR
jgi:hypothetical protein